MCGVRRTDRQDEGNVDTRGIDVQALQSGMWTRVARVRERAYRAPASSPDPAFHHEICKPENTSSTNSKSVLLH
jgi:hypothetical protein